MAARKYRLNWNPGYIQATKRGCSFGVRISNEAAELDESHVQQSGAGIDVVAIAGVISASGEESCNCLGVVTRASVVGKVGSTDILKILEFKFVRISAPEKEVASKQLNDLAKLIGEGEYYFSINQSDERPFDITSSFQSQLSGSDGNSEYFWNKSLWAHFAELEEQIKTSWLIRITCGYINFKKCYAGARQIHVGLISRLSTGRVGTRFMTRGIDDSGYVANYVESETIVIEGENIFAHLQIRGSVPTFWEQPGINFGQHKCNIVRNLEGSYPASFKHFSRILDSFSDCRIVNLLGKGEGEDKVSSAFAEVITKAQNQGLQIEYTAIDYHKETPKGKNLRSVLMGHIGEALTNHHFLNFSNGSFVSQQSGVVRTNCLDCLDRTNAVQTVIALEALVNILREMNIDEGQASRFNETVKGVWSESGNAISHMYAGTGALESGSKLQDATRSISRTIKNNTGSDENKQRLIERLLYGDLPTTLRGQKILSLIGNEAVLLSKDISENIYFRKDEFTTELPIRVSCCTWNVNGGTRSPNLNTDLGEDKFADWLLGKADRRRAAYDFTGEAETDLSFVAGDIITVTGTSSKKHDLRFA